MATLLLASCLILATASHGVLDAFTSGGQGVGFSARFDSTRHFFPWQPIRVSPLTLSRLFSTRFWAVLGSEMRWIVGPALLFAILAVTAKQGYWQLREKRENGADCE